MNLFEFMSNSPGLTGLIAFLVLVCLAVIADLVDDIVTLVKSLRRGDDSK